MEHFQHSLIRHGNNSWRINQMTEIGFKSFNVNAILKR